MTRCCYRSCPEIVPVTVNQTIVEVNGLATMFRYEATPTLVVAGNSFTLAEVPIHSNSVVITLNGVRLAMGTHYSIAGRSVALLNMPTLTSSDRLVVSYVSAEPGDLTNPETGAFETGFITSWAGDQNTPPSGWFICDGAAVSRTAEAALYAAIGTSYGVGDGSTTFNLPLLSNSFYDGSSFVVRVAIIKR